MSGCNTVPIGHGWEVLTIPILIDWRMRPSQTQTASIPMTSTPEPVWNRPERTRRLLTIGLVLLLGSIISCVMFGLVQSRERNYRDVEFKNRAQERADAIENTFRE